MILRIVVTNAPTVTDARFVTDPNIVERVSEFAFVIIDLTGGAPSAFYVLGLARSIGVPVITVAFKGSVLPAEFEALQTLTWDTPDHLKELLLRKIETLSDTF